MQYVLHADDDALDRENLIFFIASFNRSIKIVGFSNRLELMQYLGTVPVHLLPCAIFLDLRMPIWDNIRTLKALQSDARYCAIKVYMWSTTDLQSEIDLSIRLGAVQFITKPQNAEEWISVNSFLSDQFQKLAV